MDLNAKISHENQNTDDSDTVKIFVKEKHSTPRFHYNPSHAPQYDDEEPALILNPANRKVGKTKRSLWFRCVQAIGVILSLSWAVICASYFIMEGGLNTQTPYELGIFIAGMTAPIAFFWMFLSYLQRNNDVRFYAENLRGEMHSLFFPSEEESRHVNKDIERMTQQAAELAASSRAALKSIHRTRQGLRHEIKEFANFARKAESHLISLSDRLAERTVNVADMTDVLEQRMAEIESRSHAAILVWDDASARMVERSSDIEAAMEQGANRILSMAEVAEERSNAISEMFDGTITSLGLTVDAVTNRLGGINDEFGSNIRALQISSDELSKETSRIGTMIEGQIDQLQETAGRSVEAISHSLVEVSVQKDLLEESAEKLSKRADKFAEIIYVSATKLNETSDDVVSRADEIEGRLTQKATAIANTLNNFEEQIDRIEDVSDFAHEKLNEGLETVINGSNHITEAVQNSINDLSEASNDAVSRATIIIESTLEHIQQLKDAEKGNSESLEKIVSLFENSRKQIEETSLLAASHTQTLTQSLETHTGKLEISSQSLADQVFMIVKTLEEPLKLVADAVIEADSKHEHIQQTLDRRIVELRQASDKATDAVDDIRQSMREQTSEISSLSGRVLSQSKTLNKELSENKVMLNQTIETALTDMNRLMSNITEKSDRISGHTATVIRDISDVTDAIENTAGRLNTAAAKSTACLKSAQDGFIETATVLDNKITNAESVINSANNNLVIFSEKILPLYDRVETGSHSALTHLNAFKESYEEITEASLSRVDYATAQFQDRLTKLKASSDETTSALKTTSDSLREKLTDVECAAETANLKMHQLKTSMDNQAAEIHIITDQATLKMTGIQRLVNDQFHELAESVGIAVTQIGEACDQFNIKSEKINESANLITERFINVGDDVYAKAYELKQLSTRLGETSQDTVNRITTHINGLTICSEQSLLKLDKAADSLSIKSNDIMATMQMLTSEAKTQYDDIRKQVHTIAETSDNSSRIIGKSVTALLGTMDDVDLKTKSVVNYIQNANESLYSQSSRFVTAVSKSAQTAEHASEIFSSQSDNLLKASKIASEKIEDIRNAELRAGRDNFLTSARFVLESLHSLSIDFVRMIDGDIADKDWKSYQKGDIAIFSSKLADRLERIPSDKIRNKYAEDGEFRNYVQKFMHQFEDVLQQTDTIDRGAILGTTFAASDVGKIYRFLCNVTGQNDKVAA